MPPRQTPTVRQIGGNRYLRRAALRWPSLGAALALALASLAPAQLNADIAERSKETALGLPFKRSYSLDEIGVSRGIKLSFDPIGRLAVIDSNKYVVLNDSSWINLLARDADPRTFLGVANDESGNTYFGSLANWGVLERSSSGTLSPASFRPEAVPVWVNSNNFEFVVPSDGGVFFAGINGIVFWDRTTQENVFFECHSTARMFSFDGNVYVSSHTQGLLRIDLASRSLVQIRQQSGDFVVINKFADLGTSKAVVSTTGRRLVLFSAETFSDWPNALGTKQEEPISNIISLPDGGLAIAIDGRGIYVLTEDGRCQLALTTPEYQRISHLACQEPGVLWVATENEVQKVLYREPVTILDQRSGIAVSWPQTTEWMGNLLIASHGALYQTATSSDNVSRTFQKFPNQPEFGVLGIAAIADQLLVGNGEGIFSLKESSFEPTIRGIVAHRLIPIGNNLCFAVDRTQIALLRWDGISWSEAAPRVEGVGFPFLSVATPTSAWLELGINRAARITYQNEKIRVQVFDDLPWRNPPWIHIGLVENLVVLMGPNGEFFFFDEKAEQLVEAPDLAKLFLNAPVPMSRVMMDKAGTIWAGYEHGIYAIHPDTQTYDLDSFKSVQERYPIIQLSGTDDVWVSTGTTLYHVGPSRGPQKTARLQPLLLSVTDINTRKSLYSLFSHNAGLQKIPYSQNSLELLFFGGGYASARPLRYEFKLSSDNDEWTLRSAGSTINLARLKEGSYRLTAQLFDEFHPASEPIETSFAIIPPWYRSSPAYLSYIILVTAAFLSAISLATRSSKRKQAYLETLVNERTNELKDTMRRLGEKEQNAAILAERNRLASEIHDSVQQGLSGLALQLDATLKLPNLEDAVESRLSVARRMVTFTRHEVQQAVWDLESPFLQNAELGEALGSMASLIGSGETRIEVHASKLPYPLDSLSQHNLLRIAQEAITNSVRHGKADLISVNLHCDDQTISLSVSDNGCGFDPQEVIANAIGHFGLRGMKARAAKINGILSIESKIGSGTKVEVSLPLNEKPPS